MPYLPAERRMMAFVDPETPGDLNYALTITCLDFLSNTEGRYADYATVVGALECAKLEFYRRAVAVYEDECIERNGDVYCLREVGPGTTWSTI